MWMEERKNKNGEVKYFFIEKYKDPLTNKERRVSTIMKKNSRQSQKEAQRILDKRIKEKLESDKNYVPGVESLTFTQLAEKWFESYKLTSGSKRSTITAKGSKINTIKRRIPSDILAKNLNSHVLQQFINELFNEGYSQAVRQDYFRILRNILKHGQKKYKIGDVSYIDDVDIPKVAMSREQLKAKRENYLEYQQVTDLVDAMHELGRNKRSGYQRHAYLMSAYATEFQALNGMRIGELLAIQPDNIDFDNKNVVIEGTILWEREGTEYGFKDSTKNESSYRTLSLTQRSIDILRMVMLENKKLKQWEDQYQERGFLFVDYKGNPLSKSTLNRCIQAGAAAAGIEKKVTTHTLRHSHISLLSELGVSLKAIMERVGHTDHKTTLQIYSHVTEKMDKEMMDKLERVSR